MDGRPRFVDEMSKRAAKQTQEQNVLRTASRRQPLFTASHSKTYGLEDRQHLQAMWTVARQAQCLASQVEQLTRSSMFSRGPPTGDPRSGPLHRALSSIRASARWRLLFGAVLRRHPWAGLLLATWDATPHFAARQVAALTASWVAMLAAAAAVNYYRGAQTCADVKSLLGCDMVVDERWSAPFQACLGAGSCAELFSRHLCGSHGTCPQEFEARAGGDWWSMVLTALVICSVIATLLRDLPAMTTTAFHLPPRAERAAVAVSQGLGRSTWATLRGLAAVRERCCWQVVAWRVRWRFWQETQQRGRGPWAVFQELEAKEAMGRLRRAGGRSDPDDPEEVLHWTPAESLTPGDLFSFLLSLGLVLISFWLLIHYSVWNKYLLGEAGEMWTIFTWLLAVLMDGFVSPIVCSIALWIYHLVACRHGLQLKGAMSQIIDDGLLDSLSMGRQQAAARSFVKNSLKKFLPASKKAETYSYSKRRNLLSDMS
ncbi:hypothetical protein CYMTET_48061 [Cymbomonas tetramitiformis]|uniref:Uncharacterized protein n=1 Tax=Cymbomonas tetramitiformis TaxID=36881 RepID=A0AAE0EVD3_9CHLO|nr:hypothetical protein CYMTET_48061 [Cymbomonas tetramitiformis]